jgi:oligosaccharide reducing-end xylanase
MINEVLTIIDTNPKILNQSIMLKNTLFLMLSFLIVSYSLQAQVVSPYQVGTWSGFRTCAISYTFDDGCANQFAKAIPHFNEAGFKLTLFTVTGWTSNWTNLQNAAAKGHEVANHSATHPNLSTLAVDKQKAELETSNSLINSKVTSQKSLTMATPYCAKGNDLLASHYFLAVRGCQGFIEPKTPGSFMNVSSVICGNLGSVFKVKDFKSKADQAATSKGWLVYLIHGIDNDGGYSPLASDTLKLSLKYLKENDNLFWVNTFGNVARYIKERNCVSVTETLVTETDISLALTDTLRNNEWYNYPLTIRRSLPSGWTSASVTQNGKLVNSSVLEVNSVKYLQFDAVPDGGSIVISKAAATGQNELKGSSEQVKFKVWTDRKMIFFTVPSTCLPNPTVSLFSSNGMLVDSFNDCQIDGEIGKVSMGRLIKSGVFVVRLNDKRSAWSGQIIVP